MAAVICLFIDARLRIQKLHVGDGILHDGVAGQRRTQCIELRAIRGIGEIESGLEAGRLGRAIVGVRHQHAIPSGGQALRHVAHRRTKAERIDEQDDGGPAPISLRMDQRRIADAARSMYLHIRLHHSAGGGGGNARNCGGAHRQGQRREFTA